MTVALNVLDLVTDEMARTKVNNPEATQGDYVVDIIRYLANQLPADDSLRLRVEGEMRCDFDCEGCNP